MFGLLTLLACAAVLVVLVLTIILLHEATHPPRRTAGYAVARGLPVDPGEMRLEFENWLLDRPDGIQLPVWEIIGRSEASERLTVVFVHGWGHSRIDSLSRIEPWLAWCHCVVLYDLRGHGEASDHISHLGHSEEDDLLALLEHLQDQRDDKFILVGHSMGAVIAIATAARQSKLKEKIAGVIAYGPYIDFHGSLRGRLRAHGYPTRPMTDLMLLWLRLRGRPPLCLGDSVANVACPLFVVHGTLDAVSPMADAHRIVELAPDGRLREVEGAVHSDPQLFHNPDHLDELATFTGEIALRTQIGGPASASEDGSSDLHPD